MTMVCEDGEGVEDPGGCVLVFYSPCGCVVWSTAVSTSELNRRLLCLPRPGVQGGDALAALAESFGPSSHPSVDVSHHYLLPIIPLINTSTVLYRLTLYPSMLIAPPH
jgi:hypothetical protein